MFSNVIKILATVQSFIDILLTILHTEEAHHVHTINGSRKFQECFASKCSLLCAQYTDLFYRDISNFENNN